MKTWGDSESYTRNYYDLISSGWINFPAAANNWDKEGSLIISTIHGLVLNLWNISQLLMTMSPFNSYCTKHKNLVLQLTESLKLDGNYPKPVCRVSLYVKFLEKCVGSSWAFESIVFFSRNSLSKLIPRRHWEPIQTVWSFVFFMWILTNKSHGIITIYTYCDDIRVFNISGNIVVHEMYGSKRRTLAIWRILCSAFRERIAYWWQTRMEGPLPVVLREALCE